MKSTNVALSALAGMLLTSISVYSLTPPGGVKIGAPEKDVTTEARGDESKPVDTPVNVELGRFTAGSTLIVEGRAAHPKILRSSQGETFILIEVRGAGSGDAKPAVPVNLALVIDRSGSMKGSRIQNAVNAATAAVDRLRDGDVVSVVTFDTKTAVVVPPTTIGPGERERAIAGIRAITLGGDTCVSCGVEEGLVMLERTSGRVNRMIVLSDGDANHGVRDVPGFRSIGERARTRGASVTTIGVDLDYNEKILSALAQESNGRHYFVENDDGLARIFEAEAESLSRSVAGDAEASIDLAPGVELDRVLDRSFRRAGNRVTVPLGTFERDEVKTVLLKVRVPLGAAGLATIATAGLRYRDLVLDKEGTCEGRLDVEITDDPAQASAIDPVVAARVSRSETASALKEANALFERGRFDEAKRALDRGATSLRTAAERAKGAAAPGRKNDIDKDFESQIAALDEANNGFATPPPVSVPGDPVPSPPRQESRAGKGTVKKNQEKVLQLAQ